MLTAAKKFLRFLKLNMKCNLLSAMEYRKSFVIQVVFMMINNFFFMIFWITVFRVNGDEIHGLTMKDICYLWSFSTIAYGIANFLFGGAKDLGKYILEGTFDTYLIQPKNIIMNVASSSSDFSGFGDLLYGLIVGFVAVEGNIGKYVILIMIGIFCSIFYICTNTLIKLLTVWVGDTENISRVYYYTLLVTFSSYPEQIYGGLIKFLIYTIIPAGYVSFVPIHFIGTFAPVHLLILLIAACAYILLTILATKAALNHYESGNAMVMRG